MPKKKSPIEILLNKGPLHSSTLARKLAELAEISENAARKRLSRAKEKSGNKICTLTGLRLENRASMYCLDWQQPVYASALLNALKEDASGSKYARLLIALRNSEWISPRERLAIRSGLRLQSNSALVFQKVLSDLITIGTLEEYHWRGQTLVKAVELDGDNLTTSLDTLDQTLEEEEKLIFRLSRYLAKNRFVSSGIVSRRDQGDIPQCLGYGWDVTGPSYLLPLSKKKDGPPAVVVDAMVGTVDKSRFDAFKYKVESTVSSTSRQILPILVAEAFHKPVLKHGNKQGWMLVTIGSFLGAAFAKALKAVRDIRTGDTSDPDEVFRAARLCLDASHDEGQLGNLKGMVFELLVLYSHLVSGARDFRWRKKITEQDREIDVVVEESGKAFFIECKSSKNPVTGEDVRTWWKDSVQKWRKWAMQQERYQSKPQVYRFIAANGYDREAKKEIQKVNAKKYDVEFKTGDDLLDEFKQLNQKPASDALKSHFLEGK